MSVRNADIAFMGFYVFLSNGCKIYDLWRFCITQWLQS